MMDKNKYCKDCWPVKRRGHLFLHLDYYLTGLINSRWWPLNFLDKNIENFWNFLLEILSVFKIVSFVDDPEEEELLNRGLIFFKEGRSRGLDIKAIKVAGSYTNEFKFNYKSKSYYYNNIPLTIFDKDVKTEDKQICREMLAKEKIPVPRGRVFKSAKKAVRFGKEVGFPLVVKPVDSSLSCHVTYPINSKEELLKAIRVAKIYKPAFIVEEFIKGDLFRADVLGGEEVFVCRKEKPNVVGDGKSTIEELIRMKNKNRGNGLNFTLQKIPIGERLVNNLKSKNLKLKSIPPKNKRVVLYNKKILSQGCDIVSVNSKVHEENKKLFLKVAKTFRADLIGIDFICPNISKPHKEQKTAIIEVNNLPYTDMHQNPSSGESSPVAQIGWDITLKRLENKSKGLLNG